MCPALPCSLGSPGLSPTPPHFPHTSQQAHLQALWRSCGHPSPILSLSPAPAPLTERLSVAVRWAVQARLSGTAGRRTITHAYVSLLSHHLRSHRGQSPATAAAAAAVRDLGGRWSWGRTASDRSCWCFPIRTPPHACFHLSPLLSPSAKPSHLIAPLPTPTLTLAAARQLGAAAVPRAAGNTSSQSVGDGPNRALRPASAVPRFGCPHGARQHAGHRRCVAPCVGRLTLRFTPSPTLAAAAGSPQRDGRAHGCWCGLAKGQPPSQPGTTAAAGVQTLTLFLFYFLLVMNRGPLCPGGASGLILLVLFAVCNYDCNEREPGWIKWQPSTSVTKLP